MSRARIILGGQYGSEGKGAYAQWIAKRENPSYAIRTGGPNAGHSVIGDGGIVALRHIPAAVAASPDCYLVIPAAGLINVDVLLDEIKTVERVFGTRLDSRLMIDRHATIINDDHEQDEADLSMREEIGSTMEGVGAAQAHKILRRCRTADTIPELSSYISHDVAGLLSKEARNSDCIFHIETTQGFELGLHAGHYPFATSRDLTPGQALSDCGLSPTGPIDIEVDVVCRTYPIRVAGNSGELPGEMSWAELTDKTGGYVKPEHTTVTKLERRIGRWDAHALGRMARIVRPTRVILTFYDYKVPELGGQIRDRIAKALETGTVNKELAEITVALQDEAFMWYASGDLDKYREPFRDICTVEAISLGFGAVVPCIPERVLA